MLYKKRGEQSNVSQSVQIFSEKILEIFSVIILIFFFVEIICFGEMSLEIFRVILLMPGNVADHLFSECSYTIAPQLAESQL